MEKDEVYYDCKGEQEQANTAEFVDAVSNDDGQTKEEQEQVDEFAVDEEHLKELEALMTDEEKQENRRKAQVLKEEGNLLFVDHNWSEAAKCYTNAIVQCPPSFHYFRAILYSNRAACFVKMDQHEQAIVDCSKAIELDPTYAKAHFRRAQLYENKEETWDKALDDYQACLKLQPDNNAARAAIMRLPPMIAERNERMKADMINKMKDLGNVFLRPFGLSTDNFKLEPTAEGGYTVQMKK